MDEDTKLLHIFQFGNTTTNTQLHQEYYRLAATIIMEHPKGTERTFALRKLIESKDCIMRCKR